MENFELLKEELKNQKKAIEDKDGTVIVKRINPSPSEITEGIKSIPIPDLSIATATELDVAQGKTFFSGNSSLKTGCAVGDIEQTNALFMPKAQTVTHDSRMFYTIPEGITFLRSYIFYNNFNPITITFNSDVERIGDYAFHNAKNFIFTNFNELTKVTKLGMYCFQYCGMSEIDTANLPSTLTSFGTSCLMDVGVENGNYKLPDNANDLGQSIFRATNRKFANNITLTNLQKTNSLSAYMTYNLAFNCDFTVASCVKTIGSYFNYNGCFKNIYIPSTVTTLNSYCFGGSNSTAVSNYYLNSVVFESETPPSIGTEVFAIHNIQNGFKIYVPDNVVEEYKALNSLKRYVENIYPISEKE